MTESIGTARLDIVVDTSSLDAGVNKAKRSTQDMAKASQDASQKMDAGTKRQVQALERQIATLGKSRAEVIKWRIEQQTSGRVAADLTARLDAQTKRMSLLGSATAKMGASAKAAVLGWASLLSASLGVGAAFAGIKNSIDFADRLDELSNRLGVSTEQLSAWGYAAKLSGTDLEALSGAIPRLSKSMAAALDDGSKMADVFKAIGVSVKDSAGRMRDVEQVLPEITDAFKRLDNDTLEAALALQLFGRSGADMLEFLNRGGDGLQQMGDRARELGILIGGDTAAGAARFNDKLDDLHAVTRAMFTQLANELLPTLTKLVEKLTELTKEGNESGSAIKWIGDQAEAAVKDLDFLIKSFQTFGDLFGGLTDSALGYYKVLNAIATLDFSKAKDGIAQMELGGSRVRDAATRDVRNQIVSSSGQLGGLDLDKTALDAMSPAERAAFERGVTSALGGEGKDKKAKKEGKSEAERELERLQKAYESFAASQRERIALFGNESEAAKVRYELENGELSKLTDAQAKKLGINKDELIANAERLDQLRDEAEVQKELDRINKAREERTQNVLDDIQAETDLLGKSIEFQDTYNKLKYAGVDANSAFGQSIIEANHALHQQAEATSRQIDLMDTFRTEASDAIADVVTGTKSLSDAFKDMFDNIAERITQMIADRWIEQLFGQMGTSGGGQSGDWIGQLFSLFSWNGSGGPGWAKGGAFDNGMPVRAFANGGVVDRTTGFFTADGRRNVMGEAGPEAIIPLTRGRDGKLGVRMEGGASNTFAPVLNQTFIVPGPMDRSTREQTARTSGREAARGIARTGR